MTGVGGRPELIIKGSNSLDGPWEVELGAFHNTTLFCSNIRWFISLLDLIRCFRNTTSYTSPGIFINRPLLLVSITEDCHLITAIVHEFVSNTGGASVTLEGTVSRLRGQCLSLTCINGYWRN